MAVKKFVPLKQPDRQNPHYLSCHRELEMAHGFNIIGLQNVALDILPLIDPASP